MEEGMEAEKLILQMQADANAKLDTVAKVAFGIGGCCGAVGMLAIVLLAVLTSRMV